MSENKFIEFIQGKGYYGALSATVIIPGLTAYFAYREVMDKLYYLNLVIGLGLLAGGFYVYQKYKTLLKEAEEAAIDIMNAFEYNEEQKQAALKEMRKNVETTIGSRSRIFAMISMFIGLVLFAWSAWSIKKQNESNK